MQTPNVKHLMHPIHLCSLGFGSGLAPKAPGTFGTLAALIIFLPLSHLSLLTWAVITVIGFLYGIFCCAFTANELGEHDHSAIVWDEFIGFWFVLLFIPHELSMLLFAFVLFRFFDICKPWPIKQLDKTLKGGIGIMLDDLLAGIYTVISLKLITVCINMVESL